ncbi:MAG: NAD(P)-dependent oxidoreductase [Pseudomonadota bacterium]|nr:NAD(P)-dependent oxidoreductase [Pseudomonadota bacterium]
MTAGPVRPDQRQKIVVLGARGFIGGHVTRALAMSDWATPVATSRRALPPDEILRLRLDATYEDQVHTAIADAAGVVNCVSGSVDTIIRNARALFGAAARLPRRPRIVYLSSMAVYGSGDGNVDESTPLDGVQSAYGAAKLEAERLGSQAQSLVILRPGIVYGPGSTQWSGRIGRYLDARRVGDLGAAGDGFCNLVYIDDVVNAIIGALRLPGSENHVFNLSLPDPPTWNEHFIQYAQSIGAVPVARVTGRRLRLETRLFAPPLKVMEIVLARVAPRLQVAVPEAMPPSLLHLFGQRIRLKVGRAEDRLGLRWTAMPTGVRQAAEWYRVSGR